MHALAVLALAGAAVAIPAAPASAPPAGCSTTYNGQFTIEVINATTSGSKAKRQTFEPPQTSLDLTLNNGVMMDKFGRTGYIASNYQFQFDTGAQPGAIYTSGFSVCQNSSIALGGSAIFYACKVADYYNLYSQSISQSNCGPVYMDAAPISGGGSGGEQSDGQPTLTAVGEKTEGQPTVTAIGEKTDGQPTVTAILTSPAGEKTDGQPTVTAILTSPVGEKSEGQPTVTAILSTPVGEKSEGQPTVTAIGTTPAGEQTDGQPTVTAIGSPSVTPIVNAAATPKVEMLALGAAALAAALL